MADTSAELTKLERKINANTQKISDLSSSISAIKYVQLTFDFEYNSEIDYFVKSGDEFVKTTVTESTFDSKVASGLYAKINDVYYALEERIVTVNDTLKEWKQF